MRLTDRHNRPLRSLRISVTDRCNLRCNYCMPEDEYTWIPRDEILHFEEVARLVDVFAALGVDKLRITGGEPLLRRDLPVLIGLLAKKAGIRDLALTSNGMLLAEHAAALAAAGLRRLTVSLDSLRADRFRELTRHGDVSRVQDGIRAARAAGLAGTKINSVIVRSFNDDELCDLIEFGKRENAQVRFIEYMDVGGATGWRGDKVVSRAAMLEVLSRRYGAIEPVQGEDRSAPADRFRLSDGTEFGIIASTTEPFCGTCDRARLTADGHLLLCLYARRGIDLKTPLRAGASHGELLALLEQAWRERTDRGAQERHAIAARGPFVQLNELRSDTHLEMHTRGG